MSDPWPPRPPSDTEPTRPVADDTPAQAPLAAPAAPAAPAADGDGPGVTAPGVTAPDGPSANRKAFVIAGAAVVVLLAIAALAAGPVVAPGSPTFPPAGATTGPAGSAAAATRAEIVAAFAAQGLQAEDVGSPYRPAEAARFAAAPRIVVRAVIPTDPDHGRVVVYEFRDTGAATTAAQEQATYVASGVGRVQFPSDTRFTLRVVGSTVIFYAWSTGNQPDPERAASIGLALATLGFDVPVPN